MSIQVDIRIQYSGFGLQVTFENENNRMGILGASGCGKSLTLKCIAGIERPDSGRIVLDGRVLFDSEARINIPASKRRTGYLFQNYALFPNMTVRQNIGIALHCGKAEKEQRIQEQISRFRLDGLEDRRPGQLSGGQQQRTALARILASDPDIIMLDEPFSALDSFLKETLMEELMDALQSFRGDIIIVSHSRDEVYKLCDKVGVMESGRFLLTGETREIFQNPVKVEAAKLTGCQNISPIRKISDYELLATDWGISLKTAQKVTDEIRCVGIRAHSLIPKYTQEGDNCIKVSLLRQSDAPFETQYAVVAKENCRPVIWKMAKNEAGHSPGQEQFPPYLQFSPEALLLLEE